MDASRGRGRARGWDKPPQPQNGNPRPGQNGGEVTTQMKDMNLGNGGGMGRGSTRGNAQYGGARPKLSRQEVDRIKNEKYDLVRTRPKELKSKMGTSGQPIRLLTNHIRFVKRPDFKLYQYRIDMVLEDERTPVKKNVFCTAFKAKFNKKFIFDGTILLTAEAAFPHTSDSKVMHMEGTYKKDPRKDESEIVPVPIKITLVGEVDPCDHHFIHFYNLLIKKILDDLDLKQMGRSNYDTKAVKEEKQFRLKIYPGYTTSVRQHEDEVLMVAEVSHKIVRTDSVLEQIMQMKRRNMSLDQIKAAIIGMVIMSKYNDKTYRVDDIDTNTTASSSFSKKDGTMVTYLEYYSKKYDLHIRDRNQFLLVSRPTEKDRRRGDSDGPILLVPELCLITGLDDQMRANFRLMDSLAKYTKMDPPNRLVRLRDLARRFTKDSKSGIQELKEWDMQMDEKLVELNGRVMEPETLFFNNNRKFNYNPWVSGPRDNGADWSMGTRDGLFNPTPITRWMIVYPVRDEQNVNNFMNEMSGVTRKLMDMKPPKKVVINDTRTGTYIQELKRVLQDKPHFLMVVIPNEKDQTYAAVKKLLCCESPCPSQVVTVSKVIGKPQKHRIFATKIAIQMTAKIGGTPWTVAFPIKDYMVVGFDTYHDTMRKGSSWGAMVASLNNTCSLFHSDVSEHPSRQEMSNQIPIMFMGALRAYKKRNHGAPKRVFFYRDGLGDGQIQQVLDQEVAKLKEICEQEKVLLTFIIVSKRINTRFFAKQGPNEVNPPSGTVVDSVVTLPQRYDFFLISQSVRQGTVNPTSYNVIYDNSGLKPEHLQKLSYKLCHLYFNWTGTVRVPAPCQYAHKLAYLIGESIHSKPAEELCDMLYFL